MKTAKTLRFVLRAALITAAVSASVAAIAAGVVELLVDAETFPIEDLGPTACEASNACTKRPKPEPGSIRVRDARGQLLREATDATGARAQWTPLEELSPRVIEATIAVEDERFFDHAGVDWLALGRAIAQNLWERRIVSGASTLTMQLVRLVNPHPKNMRAKLGEAIDALRLERVADKRTVLEQYLNRAPYGAGTIGVEAASQRYFGKPSAHLSLAEAALLAGLPKAPTALNPIEHPEAAKRRRATVLRRLRESGRATPEEVRLAEAEPIELALLQRPPAPRAMHFTDWILAQGARGEVATTLDGDLQEEVERAVAEHVERMSSSGLTNAAVVVLDNSTCAVLAMVGSSDYFDPRSGAVNGALARRQPGSTLKPFTYALAFERGATPATSVADIPTRYGDPAGELFSPQNFSGSFLGPITMAEALGRSLNVPAIRAAGDVGADRLLERLRRAGFSSLDRPASHYGLGLTLGNGEVTLLELAEGYAAFARGGARCRAHGVANGVAGGAFEGPPEQVFSEQVAWMITRILSDEGLRIAAFGPANALLVGFEAAAKTGTSSDFKDSWTIGYTTRFTVAVWAGDFEGRPMSRLTGATGAGPLFHKVLRRVVERSRLPAVASAAPPAGVTETLVCAASGARPTEHCSARRMVPVPHGALPEEDCPFHRPIAVDVRNGLRAGEGCPERFVEHRVFDLLPARFAEWQAESGGRIPPARPSPLCTSKGVAPGELAITAPRTGEVYLIEPGYDRRTQSVELRSEIEPPVDEVTWLVDGRAVATAAWPYRASWPLEPGLHTIEVAASGRRSQPVRFEVR